MIRNYNGNVNRGVVRDLRRLCDVNEENKKSLFETFNQKGEVSVYENLNPFTRCSDELSNVVTMKSEAEIQRYLKKDFSKRLEGYLEFKKPEQDYLLSALLEFIRQNHKFPERNEMRQLEKDAEAKRIAELPPHTVTAPKVITEQDMAREILELAEEIMESRRESNPADIVIRIEPYPESYYIDTEKFQGSIFHDRYYSSNDNHDYRCAIRIKGYQHVEKILLRYFCRDSHEIDIIATDFVDNEIDVPVTKYLITIHKGIAEMARAEGVEFTSEIDYDKLQVA